MLGILWMAVIWLTSILIIVPWFFILILPWFLSAAAFAIIPPGVLLVLRSRASKQRAAGKTRNRVFEIAKGEPFSIFIQEAPGLQNRRESLEGILVEHQRRMSEKIGACACMMETRTKVVLTLQISHNQRYLSHQVRGRSAEDAIRRMEWKLTQAGSRYLRRSGDPTVQFRSRPWCRNSARCPHRDARVAAMRHPKSAPRFAS